jgi:hypothetical protein
MRLVPRWRGRITGTKTFKRVYVIAMALLVFHVVRWLLRHPEVVMMGMALVVSGSAGVCWMLWIRRQAYRRAGR